MEMQKRNYKNDELKVEINCYVDKENNIRFRGNEIALILDYKNPLRAIRNFVHEDDKKLIDFKIKQNPWGNEMLPQAESPNSSVTKMVTEVESRKMTRKCVFINESGFYSLILSSKQNKGREFKYWVTSKVLPSIRKHGYYNMKSNRLLIESEYDLHSKVLDFIRKKYDSALLIASLGENQKTEYLRLSSWKKGYMAGQCDLMIMNPTSKFNSL